MKWVKDDGGRAAAGFKGQTGDCVVRAIAIATETPYQQVYNELKEARYAYMLEHDDKTSRRIANKGTSPRNGTSRNVYELYLATKGFVFKPTMTIGSGCLVHLRANELPPGRIIVRLSRHLAAVIDGVVHDTHDPSRGGTRCVYGYYARV